MKKSTISEKIVELEKLTPQILALKKQKKKIVHCHGVFDLLHIGHIRHFAQAKAMGDVLVVTLTPDQYVNKGPHRPAFTQTLRAEAIAALDAVDFVAINQWPSAEETIRLLKPTYYVKGSDYKDATKDVTGGINHEEEAIRSVGGEIRFTDDITFSSSSLVNQHLSLLPPAVKAYIEQFRVAHKPEELKASLDSLRSLKVLVVGDTILDDYIYCDAMGRSSKEPILAMRQLSYEMFAGGVLAIANHVAEFCNDVEVLTYLGKTNPYEDFIRGRLKPSVKFSHVLKSDSPTIIKRRYVENYQLTKMFEVYLMNDEPLQGAEEEEFYGLLKDRLSKYDVVIVADYGHGLMTPKTIELVSKRAKFLAVNTQINASNMGFHTISKYPHADYICIHEGELRLEHRSRKGDLHQMVTGIAKRLDASTVMVTRGKTGTLVFDRKKKFHDCPAFAVKVVDRIGAGDAVLALTSMCAAKNVPGDVIGFLGNLVGAQAVMIIGNRSSIDRVQLQKSVESLLK